MKNNNLYNRSVFINCPYDKDYSDLLKAIIFTVSLPGLVPVLSVDNCNNGINRLTHIQELIKESKYGIHDISRMQIEKGKDKYARMNMPFELGIDIGCLCYYKKDKSILIMDEKPYRYQKAISDLSGVDVICRGTDEKGIINAIRKWVNSEYVRMPGCSSIWGWYKGDFWEFVNRKAPEKDQTQDEVFNDIGLFKDFTQLFFKQFDPVKEYQDNNTGAL